MHENPMKILVIHFLVLSSLIPTKDKPIYLILDVWIEGQNCWSLLKISEEETSAQVNCPKALSTFRELYLNKSSVAKSPDLKFYQIKPGYYRFQLLENGYYEIKNLKIETVDPDYLILD